ncbi:Gluconate transport-inducing protein [Neophaeococcomyces mojaviensis]|uniref:Gluconate transport-inducing protein n=1 Tax=Neophaeococcomyces mojaviensis TaxID=3383035 RepID=A0ACC3A533_9EURO|nr:Gluconate transport-inducing protein [Knufia sp. JES_112]
METYNGHVRTPQDAIILFEACRLGLLPRVQRRLSEKERQSIRSGSVFVWDEREAGMRRWTDGKSWSASRVSGSFLTYREMEGKRGGTNYVQPVNGQRGNKTPDNAPNGVDDGMDGEEGPDGYRYKPDGLMKQSFSLTSGSGAHLHLISYYSRSHPTAQILRQPSNDPALASIQIPKGMYPESNVADASNTPAVTRSPMPGAPNYVMATGAAFTRAPPAPPPQYLPGFIPHPAGYMYPISPIHTPPGHYPYHYAHFPGLYHPAYAAPPPPPPPPPPPHAMPAPLHINAAPPSLYDQRPLRNSIAQPRSPPRTSLPITNGSYSQDRTQAVPQSYPITPASERPPSVQIDPRLTEAVSQAQPVAPNPAPTTTNSNDSSRQEPVEYQSLITTASQAPSINALVHAAQQAAPLPTNRTTEVETERQGSTSPGGSKFTAPPQDIPSEKLAFREDKMALSKLDRRFAFV